MNLSLQLLFKINCLSWDDKADICILLSWLESCHHRLDWTHHKVESTKVSNQLTGEELHRHTSHGELVSRGTIHMVVVLVHMKWESTGLPLALNFVIQPNPGRSLKSHKFLPAPRDWKEKMMQYLLLSRHCVNLYWQGLAITTAMLVGHTELTQVGYNQPQRFSWFTWWTIGSLYRGRISKRAP